VRFGERVAEDEESDLDFKATHKCLCECRRHCLKVVKEKKLTEVGGLIVNYISLADDETKVLVATGSLSIVKKVREALTHQVNIGWFADGLWYRQSRKFEDAISRHLWYVF
jgi:hypothetical protein